MAGREEPENRIAIDFGLEHTVVALGKENAIRFPALPGSRAIPGIPVPVIPSCIHLRTGNPVIGAEVLRLGLEDHPSTVHRIRHYIAMQNPARVPDGSGGEAGYADAGSAFLTRILKDAVGETGELSGLHFVVPPGSPRSYRDWVRGVRVDQVSPAGSVDAITATLSGYNATPGDLYLVADIGESSCTATVARAGGEIEGGAAIAKVLGTAGEETGSAGIDGGIVGEALLRGRIRIGDPRIRKARGLLGREAARVREMIPVESSVTFGIRDPGSGLSLSVPFPRSAFREILSSCGMYRCIEQAALRALADAERHGADPSELRAILLTGSDWRLPGMQECFHGNLGPVPVCADHLLDARCRGALQPGSVPCRPRIGNDYAIRYWDAPAREHRYRFLVRAGTPYPSAGQVGRFVICAAYDGQTHLGIPLFRFDREDGGDEPRIELVTDSSGGMRISAPDTAAPGEGKPAWVNERAPTLLCASPPAVKGEPRFELVFTIDADRRLCLTARDLKTGSLDRSSEPIFCLD